MSKRASVKAGKGAGAKPSLTTNTAWRQQTGTATYPQKINLKDDVKT